MLTIVMYHYVRDIPDRFPNMKCLTMSKFHSQLDYFQRNYCIVSPVQVFEAVQSQRELPADALLLTFDDGYVDHFANVRPALIKRGISAAFFPVGAVLAEGKLLGINKIHLILGVGRGICAVAKRLEDALQRYGKDFALLPTGSYRAHYAHPSHLDDAETIFVKRMLQVGLPEPVRTMILDELFREFVDEPEELLAREFYMNASQLESMVEAGMYIGCHGYAHHWMDRLSDMEQQADVDRALATLARIRGIDPAKMFCYPFGGYNRSLVEILRTRGFLAAVTVEARQAQLGSDDPLALPRLDTVALPIG